MSGVGLNVGDVPVTAVHVGSTPVKAVYVGSKLVWSATVQIILGADLEARDQLRAALAARGLDYRTVTKIPFEIELVGTGSARDMFRACAALTSVPDMDTSGVTSMRSMFNGCASLTSVPAMDTSSVTNMGWMFQDCSSLTTVPTMATSNVTNMNSMFRACSLLTDGNALLAGRNPSVTTVDMITGSGLTREPFDTAQITLSTVENNLDARNQLRAALSARGLNYQTVTEIPFEIELVGTGSTRTMFRDCYALTTVPEMDTSNVTDMARMFQDCSSLTTVPPMDTSNVTITNTTFSGCSALTHVPAMDMSQVTNMVSMFQDCTSLTYVPDMDTSSATTTNSMFYGCTSLTHAPALDTSNVTNAGWMFRDCTSLTYVPDMDTSQVTGAFYMFTNCAALTDGNVRLIGKHPSVSTTNMITGSGLTKEPFYEKVQITLNTGQQVQYQLRDALTARGLNYRNVTELPFVIELVGTGETTSLFEGFSALTKVPAMDTSQVTDMQRMFYNCSSLTTVPPMDTSKVTSMYYTFYGCSKLTSVPPMDTSKVTNAQYMFNRCSALTDENVRLIGKNPSVDTMSMIDRSGLTKEPFYATDRLPNPPAPRVVTISKQGYTSQWDTSSATGDVSLIQEWTSNGRARFAAYVTCNENVYYDGSYAAQKPGVVIPSGVDVEPAMRNVYTFTEVI